MEEMDPIKAADEALARARELTSGAAPHLQREETYPLESKESKPIDALASAEEALRNARSIATIPVDFTLEEPTIEPQPSSSLPTAEEENEMDALEVATKAIDSARIAVDKVEEEKYETAPHLTTAMHRDVERTRSMGPGWPDAPPATRDGSPSVVPPSLSRTPFIPRTTSPPSWTDDSLSMPAQRLVSPPRATGRPHHTPGKVRRPTQPGNGAHSIHASPQGRAVSYADLLKQHQQESPSLRVGPGLPPLTPAAAAAVTRAQLHMMQQPTVPVAQPAAPPSEWAWGVPPGSIGAQMAQRQWKEETWVSPQPPTQAKEEEQEEEVVPEVVEVMVEQLEQHYKTLQSRQDEQEKVLQELQMGLEEGVYVSASPSSTTRKSRLRVPMLRSERPERHGGALEEPRKETKHHEEPEKEEEERDESLDMVRQLKKMASTMKQRLDEGYYGDALPPQRHRGDTQPQHQPPSQIYYEPTQRHAPPQQSPQGRGMEEDVVAELAAARRRIVQLEKQVESLQRHNRQLRADVSRSMGVSLPLSDHPQRWKMKASRQPSEGMASPPSKGPPRLNRSTTSEDSVEVEVDEEDEDTVQALRSSLLAMREFTSQAE